MVRHLGEADRQTADQQSEHGHQQQHARLDARADRDGQQLDPAAEEGSQQAEGDRIAEHRAGRTVERRQAGDRERERPEPGQ
jgi:hypothetical protein